MSQRVRWLRGSVWLLAGNFASLAATAIAGILIARSLGPSQFGVYSAVLAAAALLNAMTNFGLDMHLTTELGHEDDRNRYSEVLSAAYSVTAPLASLAAVGVVILLDGTLRLVGLVAVAGILVSPLLMARVALQVRARHAAMVLSSIFARAAWVGMVIAVVVLRPASPILWIMVARVATDLLEAVTLARISGLPFLRISTPFRQGGQVLKASWPLALSALMGFAYTRVDQLFLISIRGAKQTGIYSAGARLAELLHIAARVVQTVCLPEFARLWREDKKAELTVAVREATLLMIVPGCLGVVWLLTNGERLAVLVFGGEYRGTGAVIGILALAEIAVFFGTIATTVALVVGARKTVAVGTGLGLIVNVFFNLAFLRKYGAIAAAWGSLLGYVCAALGVAFGSRQVSFHLKPASVALSKVCLAVLVASLPFALDIPLALSLLTCSAIYTGTIVVLLPGETVRIAGRIRNHRMPFSP